MQRSDPKNWQGPVIESLNELLDYLEIATMETTHAL